jgi:hypothetical protein
LMNSSYNEMFQTNILENIKIQFYVPYFFFENHAIYEIKWKNVVEPERPQVTI